MNKIRTSFVITLIMIISAGFISCSDDDTVDCKGVEVTNTELKAILQEKGFTFNEEGKLVQNEKVMNTTALDLSNCNLSDISGLQVFPKLAEVDLSGNKFKMKFDFSVLPSTINNINLTGNEIYEYPGLVNIKTEENGDETITVLREIQKLHLPEEAKYNMDELPALYKENEAAIKAGSIDMKMINAAGSLVTYNTLRKVPDNKARELLKASFPSMFDGDYIDLSKKLIKPDEKISEVFLSECESVEGAEYIINNKSYAGGGFSLVATKPNKMPYLKVSSTISFITLEQVDTPNGIDLSNATDLFEIHIWNNPSLETLDLSISKTFGQRPLDVDFFGSTPSYINIEGCSKLKEIIFPKVADKCARIHLAYLPELETLDLSRFDTMSDLGLTQLPKCKITYLSPKYWVHGTSIDEEKGVMTFGITEDIYEKQETKDFLDTYHNKLRRARATVNSKNLETPPLFRWDNFYK